MTAYSIVKEPTRVHNDREVRRGYAHADVYSTTNNGFAHVQFKPDGIDETIRKYNAVFQDTRNGSTMIADLQSLENDTEMYDEDCIKPTSYAFARMRELLTRSLGFILSTFPLGTVYPDGSGGMRIDWVHSEKELRLIVPSTESGRQYIWYLCGMEHALVEEVSAQTLGHWLNWLNKDDQRIAE